MGSGWTRPDGSSCFAEVLQRAAWIRTGPVSSRAVLASHPGDRITPSDVFFARGKYSCLNAADAAVMVQFVHGCIHERL